jgi:hypothetical protein
VRGSAIPAPPPFPFRTWNGLPHLSIPVLASSDEGNENRSGCVSSCDGVRKEGRSRFRTAGCWSQNSNHPISYCHVRRDWPFSSQISVESGHANANPLPSAGVRGSHRDAAVADTQSICGVARQQRATLPCGIFSIGHVVTHTGMAKAESCPCHRQALRLRFVMVRRRAGGWHEIKLMAHISANAT